MKDKIQALLQSGELSGVELAFELAKSQGISVDELLEPWEDLMVYANNHAKTQLEAVHFLFNNDTYVFYKSALEGGVLPKGLTRLPRLRHIYLQDGFEEIPEIIFQLKNLKKISLVGTQMKTLPEELKQIKHLEEIEYSRCKLRQFPEVLLEMPQLRKLSLRNNNLEYISDRIGELEWLEVLDLYDTQLKDLPDSIQKLTKLQELDLSNNYLLDLPDFIYEMNLQKLVLRYNRGLRRKIKDIQAKMPNCKVEY
jgi:Leucine-rich repeat (LRR) protein